MYLLAKSLEALGIASLGMALVSGIYGHIGMEYGMFFGGTAAFLIGRQLEKKFKK